jgi:predicted regulator of Ras-like GTPase activity (Roadblock/LC7/MglB family)
VRIDEVLDQVTRVAGVRAAVFCSYDGINIASQSAVGAAEDEQVAAMAAEIGRTAKKLLRSAGGEQMQMAMFGAASGNLVMADAARGLVVAITDQAANTGLLRMEVEKAAEVLSTELHTPSADEPQQAASSEDAGQPASDDEDSSTPA